MTTKQMRSAPTNPLRHGGRAYVSTACQHALHRRCRKKCKWCKMPCACYCHNPAPDFADNERALWPEPSCIVRVIRRHRYGYDIEAPAGVIGEFPALAPYLVMVDGSAQFSVGFSVLNKLPPACAACGFLLAAFAGPGKRRGWVCYTPGCDLAEVDMEAD